MIGTNVKYFCKDDITKIENYELAMADTEEVWHCHHRLELTLDGEYAHSKEDLIRMNMYYNRPHYELIFLTNSEHIKLHNKVRTMNLATKLKLHKSLKGNKKCATATGKSWYNNGLNSVLTYTCPKGYVKGRINNTWVGRHHTPESRKKMSEAAKSRNDRYTIDLEGD